MAGAERPDSFGQLLRQHRLNAGLTQEALAERAGLSVRAVQHLERLLGQPQRETARRLADALTLPPEQRARFERAAAPAPRRRHQPPAPSAPHPPAPSASGINATSMLAPAAAEDVPAGERKRVTVLCADVRGLTDSPDGFEPDLADEILADGVRLLVDLAHRYQGTVNWVRGDGLMVLFGAPVAHEDHAIRGCYAALAMQEAFRDFAQQPGRLHQPDRPRLSLRIGLDSGEVVVRTTSNDLSTGYTAIGPAVRGATRLEQDRRDGDILLSPETARLAEGYVQVRPLAGPDSGLPAAVQAFELTGAHPARSRFQHSARARPLTRFVGRDAEVAALSLPLRRARAGHGQLMGLVGEPGVGKSRLVWEIARAPLAAGWRVLETGALSYGTGTSYLSVVALLKAYCRIEARDDLATVRAKLTTRVLTLDPALAGSLPALLSLLDLPLDPATSAEDAAWMALDPVERRRLTLDAVKRLILRESQQQPVLLVFEDLHWLDAESQTLLDSLVESLPAAQIMLLVTYRPEYHHAWAGKSSYTQLRVDPLPSESADALLDALLGTSDDSDDGAANLGALKQLLVERTEGNPLFLEESVRELVEGGALTGEPGGYTITRPVEGVRVPATVQTVLAARIDRLPPDVKRLLQLAAVIGKDVALPLLRALADRPDAALHEQLGHLQAAELLYEASLFPEIVYTFKHALTHEVAYSSLLQDRRRVIHARVVEAIERLAAGRLAEEVERLTYHAMRGEVWEKAHVYARQAGRKDAERSALRAAAASFDWALEALRRLPETRATRELAVDVRLDLRSVLYPLGELEPIVARLREAESIAETLEDSGRLARVSAYLASLFFTTGRYPAAIEAARRTETIARTSGDRGAQVLGNHYLGLAYYSTGAYADAIDRLEQNVRLLAGPLEYERFGLHGVASVFSRTPLVWSLAERGDFALATTRADEELRIAEASDHPYTLAAALQGVGLLLLRRGDDLERAVAVAERAVALCDAWEIRTLWPVVAAQHGYALALFGRVDEGIGQLTRAVQSFGAVNTAMNHGLSIGWLGEALLAASRLTDALEQVEYALHVTRHRDERGAEAWALRLLGEIASQDDPERHARGEPAYRQSLALAEELGMRPLQAHCRLGLGRLLAGAGRLDAARPLLAEAVNGYRTLGMNRWLRDAEATVVQVG